MSVTTPEASAQHLPMISEAVARLLTIKGRTRELMWKASHRLEASAGHRVYTSGLNEIFSYGLPDAEKPSGWHYLLIDGDKPLAIAGITIPDEVRTSGFATISTGSHTQELIAGIEIAEQL